MLSCARLSLATVVALSLTSAAQAQTPPAPAPAAQPAPPPPAPPPSTPQEPPPPASAVAATVNGQPISEIAVYRALLRQPPARRAALRAEVINFLVENALVDQYLEQAKVTVDPKDVDKRFEESKDDIVKSYGDFKKVLASLHITEADLRTQILCVLRFEKFTAQYATDKALRDFFAANKAMFDASQVKARHILLKAAAKDPAAVEQARAKLLTLKKQIDEQIAAGLKAVAAQDNLAREKARIKLLDEAFAAAAAKESDCPSKSAGGELGWFPRAGRMVEPFAKAAFALKPFEMSEPVATDFGVHLILVTEQKPGRETQFEKLQEIVKEVYVDRLRETLVARLRPSARITINPPPGAPAAPAGK